MFFFSQQQEEKDMRDFTRSPKAFSLKEEQTREILVALLPQTYEKKEGHFQEDTSVSPFPVTEGLQTRTCVRKWLPDNRGNNKQRKNALVI